MNENIDCGACGKGDCVSCGTLETNDYNLCDKCQTSIHESEYNKNKGLCGNCVEEIN